MSSSDSSSSCSSSSSSESSSSSSSAGELKPKQHRQAKWKGHYIDQDGTVEKFSFKNLRIKGKRVSGRGHAFCEFSLKGSVEHGHVKFVQQFEGDMTHAIYFEGDLSDRNNMLTGHMGQQEGSKDCVFTIHKHKSRKPRAWTGFYIEADESKHEMSFENLYLKKNREPVLGKGCDQCDFTIEGSNNESKVSFVKQYSGDWTHAIHYSGELDEEGYMLKGAWGYNPGEVKAQFEIRK